MCRLTPQLAGRRKTAPAPTGGREQPSTTTWPTRTTSRKPISSCTTSIGRLGRLKSCYDRGSRSGDRHLSFSPDDDLCSIGEPRWRGESRVRLCKVPAPPQPVRLYFKRLTAINDLFGTPDHHLGRYLQVA